MKKELLMITLCLGMMACSENKNKPTADNEPTKKNVVEVLYFHGTQRCATCMAIEKNTKELLEVTYKEPMENGKLVFRSMDITKEKSLAEKYEVSWSSLILVDYDNNGKEIAMNLTEFAFGHARTAPDKFKSELSGRITKMLNN